MSGVLVGLLFVCSLAAFSPCLGNGFTWDDFIYITNNPGIQQLTPHNLKTIWTAPINGSYHPLTQLSFALEYYFARSSPWLYHLDNIILHAFNSILVFILIGLFSPRPVAFITALLFCVHPLRVESVAWASERKDVLFVFFYLLALINYVFFVKNSPRDKRRFYMCLGFFILAVLSKPQAASLPLVLLSIDYLFERRWSPGLFKEKTVFIFISLLSVAGGVLGAKDLMAGHRILGAGVGISFPDKLFFSAYAFLLYIFKCILPVHLSLVYFYPTAVNGSLPWTVVGAPIMLALLVILAARIKLNRQVLWAGLFFGITIMLPVGNIWLGGNLMADRYSYLPSIAVFFVMALFLTRYSGRFAWGKCLFFCYVLFLGISSFLRCGLWKDYLSMTSAILQNHPDADTYNLRGEIYIDKGRFDLAISDFTQAIRLDPGYALFYYNRGRVFYKVNDMGQALKDFDQAVKLSPRYIDPYLGLGIVYIEQKNYTKAFEDFNRALQIKPDDFNALFDLGTAYLNSGNLGPGIQALTKAISLYPDDASLYLNRGVAFLGLNDIKEGHLDQALADFSRVIEIDPANEAAYLNRGLAFDRQGNYSQALMDDEKAISLNPNDAQAYNNKAITDFHLGNFGQSRQDALKAEALGFKVAPKLLESLNNK